MKLKKKHIKNQESVSKRLVQVMWEIEQKREEVQELVNHLNDFKLIAEVDMRSATDATGIKANNWISL